MVMAFGLRLTGARPVAEATCSNSWDEAAKSFWLIGSFLSLLHAILAMGFYHLFRHELAWDETARRTMEVIGKPIGIGIYFNYAFVLLWLADAFWWIASSKSYHSRPRWISWLIHGYLAFIAVNGAIVFESGMVRWLGFVAIGLLVWLWLVSRGRSESFDS